MPNRYTLFAAATLAATLAATAGSAQPAVGEVVVRATSQPGVEVRTKVVSVADLDLSRLEGAESALGRIRGAAHEVCAPVPTHPANLADVADYDRCIRFAMDDAVAQAHSPPLDAIYGRVR